MVRINFTQGFPQLKNNSCYNEVFFALESVRADYGGPIRSISALANCLSRNGFQVRIVQTNYKLSIDPQNFFPKNAVQSLWQFIFNSCCGKVRNPAVVFNNQWTPSVQFLAFFLILFGVKYIWFVRGNLKQDSFKKKLVWNLSQRYLLRNAYFILVSSKAGKVSVLQDHKIPKEKVFVVPNIISEKVIENDKPNLQVIENSKTEELIRIVYIGRIHRKKKIHEIISNLDILRLPSPACLTVAGYCEDNQYIRELKRLAEQKQIQVRILTNITEEQKSLMLKESDLFISMSDRENFGISIFEALWSGLCVIVDENIEFWPNSGLEAVFAVKPIDLSCAVKKIMGLNRDTDRITRSTDFRSAWLEIEKESERNIVRLFRENCGGRPNFGA